MHRRVNEGFTLIEILVALVITLVGVLGVVSLSVKSVQQEAESYQRVQALNLMQEIVEKLNANSTAAQCYSNGATGRTLGTGFSGSLACTLVGTAAQQAQATTDLAEWNNHLRGSAEQDAASANVGAVIGARGCIVLVNATSKTYRITVAWQGLGPTVSPFNSCAQNSYGNDDRLRRTVNAFVRVI